jgi:hypothetical protein
MLNALCISDLQCPFEHKDALDFVKHVDKTWFPFGDRYVINEGDEVDQHTLSVKFISNPNGKSGSDELHEAKIRLSYWMTEFPKMYLCVSNHTYRAWKKAYLAGIPAEFMKSVSEVYEAPVGWQWRDKWYQEGVCFEHGENVSGPTAALNAAIQNQMNTSIGHQHSHGGVLWRQSGTTSLWGMNTGCLIDVEQYAFDYGKNIRIKPSLGMGVIKNGIPYFVPMILNDQRRWVKYV